MLTCDGKISRELMRIRSIHPLDDVGFRESCQIAVTSDDLNCFNAPENFRGSCSEEEVVLDFAKC